MNVNDESVTVRTETALAVGSTEVLGGTWIPHHALVRMSLESILSVKRLSIFSNQQYPCGRNARMLEQPLKHPTAQTSVSMVGMDDDITEPGIDAMIGDRSRETDVPSLIEEPNAKRVAYGKNNLLSSPRRRPVGRTQQRVNRVDVKPGHIIGQRILVARELHEACGAT